MERVTYFTANLTTLSVAAVISSKIMINVTIINARRFDNISPTCHHKLSSYLHNKLPLNQCRGFKERAVGSGFRLD